MSNNNQDWYDEEEFDDFEEAPRSGDDVVKKLRRAERMQSKRVKELEAELSNLRKFQRDATVSKVLTEKGINPKIAAFIPSDMDTSEESLNSWLEQYGDVFGMQQQQPQQTQQQEVDMDNLAAMRQIDAITSNAISPDYVNDAYATIDNATSVEELMNYLYSQGAE